eukprot:CAMPEP_0171357386 /NCGR_PEP_ID=MMETSP0878-20121228/46213_1 /TAXON_ID=67004 /ORGANISM="Thalassiosira weissflogii, Strain CCMP1336" /LENGTH=263 /DNA_ID=CAMNT_0011863429 /DNA_START=222 /DNA_END=1013 /DNA_ORIENTATION=-
MERLHDPSANTYDPLEHVYCLDDINEITKKVADDEWIALGSAIAEAMLETILDIGTDALKAMGREERATSQERMAKDISNAVEASLDMIRYQPIYHECGNHLLPDEILSPLQAVMRSELQLLLPFQEDLLDQRSSDIQLLALSSINEAVESYCGVANVNAPFFNLASEMHQRIRKRRRELLVKHSRGYENVKDVERDIEKNRKKWLHIMFGRHAASDYKIGETHRVMTKLGDISKEAKRQRNREARKKFLLVLFSDLNGVLLP